MTNVFLADDHAIVLDGLEHLLSTTPDLRVVGRATHARTLLSLAGSGSWDLLVLDLSLPGGGGLEALARLRQLEPALKIVVYSMYPEAQYARQVLDAGARGYVCKDRRPAVLLDALYAVIAGGRFVSGETANEDVVTEPHEALTERERHVLTLLVEEMGPAQIASALRVSRSTVSTHIGQLKRKLGAQTLTGLVRRAIRDGLVPERDER